MQFKSLAILIFLFFLFGSFSERMNVCTGSDSATDDNSINFPYEAAGLTKEQAAAHLLNRFTFGATPALIDQVQVIGLEHWFIAQLAGAAPEPELTKRLSGYEALDLTNEEIVRKYPLPGQLLKMAKADGIIPQDSAGVVARSQYKKELNTYFKANNFGRQSDFFRQVINSKIIRATYANNQVHEVLTDFWFNHFNISRTKKACAPFILSFERDVIRPNTTGRFEDLLIATAKSPAMLLFLDNFTSAAETETLSEKQEKMLRRRMQRAGETVSNEEITQKIAKLNQKKKAQGLNENYARELMELHTLGVDGGYTQHDVTEAARILTGWTLYPPINSRGNLLRKTIENTGEADLHRQGFVHDGDFLFAVNRHDKFEKSVLGKRFPAGGGYQEGIVLLKMLSQHPSTAAFISRKLARRFVNDEPPNSLIESMTNTFLKTNGDIREVLLSMVTSPGFWSKKAVRSKTKSPFDLVISAVRILQTDVQHPYQLYLWMEKMGQKIYAYQAPTGFPDRAQFWINAGSLLNRMNFGLNIASQQIRGLKSELLSLNNHHEPESAEDALIQYCKLLLPGREHGPTIVRLKPLLTQPALEKNIDSAARVPQKNVSIPKRETIDNEDDDNDERLRFQKQSKQTETMLAQVVGIIIGSPEFQRK